MLTYPSFDQRRHNSSQATEKSHDDKLAESEEEEKDDPENTNIVERKKEQMDTLQPELNDPTAIDKIGPSRDDKEIEWLDVKEPLNLVDTSKEFVYESLIREMPKCSPSHDFRIEKDDKEIEWLDVKEPLNLVDTSKEFVYESLIREMPKCSPSHDFRIEKYDPQNLKISCMIGHKFTSNAYINIDIPMNIMSLACYNSIRKSGYEYRGRKFTSNTLRNAIMEAGSKDRLTMLAPEWQRFVTLVKQSQELKTVSYYKLYDIMKQHQNEVNEIRAERLAQPSMDAEDDETSKDKEIDKVMALISLSFNKIYKPTNNNLRTSSNTSRANQDNSLRINRNAGYENQRIGNVAGARENVEAEKGKECSLSQGKDAIELEAHYMYIAQLQEVSLDAADSEPIFDDEPVQKACCKGMSETKTSKGYNLSQGNDAIVEQVDQDDDDDFANERDLLAFLIERLKCEIDDSKNRNKFLETSNMALVDKLKGEIEDFKNKNKSLESLNNHFKGANNELSKTNELMYKDLKKFQTELDRRNDVKYVLKMEIDCAKAKGDLMSYKMESEKSFNVYTRKINDLNQTIS
nr:hypothetical protein [Tanacetum cinerariifolium]